MAVHAAYVKTGHSMDLTPAANVASGNVVVTNRIMGVAPVDIVASNQGALTIDGIFDVATDASSVFAAGDPVYWDSTNSYATNSAADGHYMGIALATNTATLVRTALNLMSTKAPPRGKVLSTTAAGGNIATAAALVEGFNLVAGANDSLGVILPKPQVGSQVHIKNAVGNKYLNVYPHVAGIINDGSANGAVKQTNNCIRTYYALDTTNWYSSISPEV
jgi:predicted RecA/RadA family phage recombinase